MSKQTSVKLMHTKRNVIITAAILNFFFGNIMRFGTVNDHPVTFADWVLLMLIANVIFVLPVCLVILIYCKVKNKARERNESTTHSSKVSFLSNAGHTLHASKTRITNLPAQNIQSLPPFSLKTDTNSVPAFSIDANVRHEYAIALLLDMHRNMARTIPEDYALFFSSECGLSNPKVLHLQLIQDGFLVPASPSELLFTLKVPDLKQILRSAGCKTSGRKSELVANIISNVDLSDIQHYFSNDPPYYSLSEKGTLFLNAHQDYVCLHRYIKFGITVDEYAHQKKIFPHHSCEEILIQIFTQKELSDKYNSIYHCYLYQLYDAIKDMQNALQEFLIDLYLKVNCVSGFNYLQYDLQYLSFSEATQHFYDLYGSCYTLSSNTASYFVHHIDFYSIDMVHKIYIDYPLKNIIISEKTFCHMLSEMKANAFFDEMKWNNFCSSQLKKYLNSLTLHHKY